ncbi:hypothetical protein OG203_10610 [Nocardia sp. NBC_01499]|uniref:hypothetical protein n=1 Tax=Nocardia sp. NBC_01499 TaxID=2903597 RepID=UPI003869216A
MRDQRLARIAAVMAPELHWTSVAKPTAKSSLCTATSETSKRNSTLRTATRPRLA